VSQEIDTNVRTQETILWTSQQLLCAAVMLRCFRTDQSVSLSVVQDRLSTNYF